MGIPKKKNVVDHAASVACFLAAYNDTMRAVEADISRALQASSAPIEAFQGKSQTRGLRIKRMEFTSSVLSGVMKIGATTLTAGQLWLLGMLAERCGTGLRPARVISAHVIEGKCVTTEHTCPISMGHVSEIAKIIVDAVPVKDREVAMAIAKLYVGAKAVRLQGVLPYSGNTWPAWMSARTKQTEAEEIILARFMKASECLSKAASLTKDEQAAWESYQYLHVHIPTREEMLQAGRENYDYVQTRQEYFKCDPAFVQEGLDAIDPEVKAALVARTAHLMGRTDEEIEACVKAGIITNNGSNNAAQETIMANANTENTAADTNNESTEEVTMTWWEKIGATVKAWRDNTVAFASDEAIDAQVDRLDNFMDDCNGIAEEEGEWAGIKKLAGGVMSFFWDGAVAVVDAIKGMFTSDEEAEQCPIAKRNKTLATYSELACVNTVIACGTPLAIGMIVGLPTVGGIFAICGAGVAFFGWCMGVEMINAECETDAVAAADRVAAEA